jgi:hypothetical protein
MAQQSEQNLNPYTQLSEAGLKANQIYYTRLMDNHRSAIQLVQKEIAKIVEVVNKLP